MTWVRWALAILFALSGATSSFAGEPRIAEKVIPGGYKIVLIDFVGADEGVAQAMIAPTAQRLCGSLTLQWGRFKLKAMIANRTGKGLKPGRFEQEIHCITPLPSEVGMLHTTFAATKADEQHARDTTLRFLEFRDAGNAEASFAMLTSDMQQTTDRANWVSEVRRMPRVVGNGVVRKVIKVTWYVDLLGVSSGVYAAADFEGSSSMLAIHCGYVALKRQSTGDFLITRIEEGRLRGSDSKTMPTEQMQGIRTALQCR